MNRLALVGSPFSIYWCSFCGSLGLLLKWPWRVVFNSNKTLLWLCLNPLFALAHCNPRVH